MNLFLNLRYGKGRTRGHNCLECRMISGDIICSSWQVVIYLIFQIAVIQRCSYEEEKATKYANVKLVVGFQS